MASDLVNEATRNLRSRRGDETAVIDPVRSRVVYRLPCSSADQDFGVGPKALRDIDTTLAPYCRS